MSAYHLTVAGRSMQIEACAPNRAAEKALRDREVGTVAVVRGRRRGVRWRYRKAARGVVRGMGRVLLRPPPHAHRGQGTSP